MARIKGIDIPNDKRIEAERMKAKYFIRPS